MRKITPDKIIKRTGIIILCAGILSGLLYFYPPTWKCGHFINEFYANLSTELISIAITILLINYLYEIKEKLALKARLIRELGSEDKGFTARALKELKEFGWLTDGSLECCDLSLANLSGLDLSNAKLKGVKFNKANLKSTIFKSADLTDVVFNNADLTGSILTRATLYNTKFIEAELYDSVLNNTQIMNCDFLKTNLTLTKIRDSEIHNTLFEEANLSFSDLEGSSVKNSKLLRADFKGIGLKNTFFERSDLSEVENWEEANELSNAKFSGTINPPIGFLDLVNQ